MLLRVGPAVDKVLAASRPGRGGGHEVGSQVIEGGGHRGLMGSLAVSPLRPTNQPRVPAPTKGSGGYEGDVSIEGIHQRPPC